MCINKLIIVLTASILSLSLTNPGLLLANDTFVYDNGRAAYPINTDKIRMVSEKITVHMDGTNLGRIAHVTCEFIFENTSNQEVIAKIGFPSEDRYFFDVPEGTEPLPPLTNFVSYIEGKETPVALRKQEANGEWHGIYWYTWDVIFPPGRKISLKNTYDAHLSLSYYNQWFGYILKTGANWKGPIERSEILVIYKSAEDLRNRAVKAAPENFKIQGNKISWLFENFIPDEDISVYEKNTDEDNTFLVNPLFWQEMTAFFNAKKYEANTRAYNKADMDIYNKEHVSESIMQAKTYYIGNISNEDQYIKDISRQFLRLLRNEIFARHGRKFKSESLNRFFAKSMKWYKEDMHYSDASLNEYEKQNIDLLLQNEMKLSQ